MLKKVIILCLSLLTIAKAESTVLGIAHRGASAHAPENTLSAIQKAIDLGSKFIEIDVHMTNDNEVVAIHDSDIDRTSNGSGKVAQHSLKELKKLDFGKWFSEGFTEERIPTLEEVLQLTAKHAVLIIEVKYGGNKYKGIEQKIIQLIQKMKLDEKVILKSFSYEILNTFERLAPQIKRLYCTFGGTSWVTLDNSLRFKSIFSGSQFHYLQVHKYFLTDWLIKESHKRGIKIIVWDVHDRETIKKFIKKGVDFIETDYPERII